ncbi:MULTISPECIES: AMP-binding protein [unclassified Streptomyces]|uniref:AMP-binding protein n=1 Tax=unclassified Streptomyces TaxID=2593676 RepID=UPI00278BC6C7|nr:MULTISPECIES: AMP-binding protein [unclassified Streptomyces]
MTSQPVLFAPRPLGTVPTQKTAPTRKAAAGRPFTLDSVFSATARRSPKAVAVRDQAGCLSYGGAENRALQLATGLVRNGLQLGDPVVVHCGDHRQSVVAQLAVLKAGGVCVPVPADFGRQAAARACEVSGAEVVLCGTATRAGLPAAAQVVVLDDARTWARLDALLPDPALPRSGPMDATYLMVDERGGQLVDNRAWQCMLAARVQQIGAAPGAVAVRQAPGGARTLSAMWWAFASGGTFLGLTREDDLVRGFGSGVAALFSAEEYDRVLAAEPGGEAPAVVVLLGGPCPPSLLERHRARYGASPLWGEFAPVGGLLPWAVRQLGTEAPEASGGTCVGGPMPNVYVRVLDRAGRVLPPGRVGELCAAGPALPFDRVGGWETRLGAPDPERGLLHRSSWLGRWRADGTLELTGPRRP